MLRQYCDGKHHVELDNTYQRPGYETTLRKTMSNGQLYYNMTLCDECSERYRQFMLDLPGKDIFTNG